MMRLVAVPPIVQPQVWNLVFNRKALTRRGRLVPGEFKHVRAYAYVPGMHLWVFYDPNFSATDLLLARDGAHLDVVRAWLGDDGEQITMRLSPRRRRWFPCGFWCVPAIKHLLGLRSGALRPDGLYRDCLRNGGLPVEDVDGKRQLPSTTISAAGARPQAVAGAIAE